MKTTETAQVEQVLVYLLTGCPKHIKGVFPRKRGVKRRELASSGKGRDLNPPKKKTRSHPVNPHMDIAKAHKRFIQEGYVRSHSHRIGHVAMVNGFRLMSNYQKEPGGLPQQQPYHREFTEQDHKQANVGPQPIRR